MGRLIPERVGFLRVRVLCIGRYERGIPLCFVFQELIESEMGIPFTRRFYVSFCVGFGGVCVGGGSECTHAPSFEYKGFVAYAFAGCDTASVYCDMDGCGGSMVLWRNRTSLAKRYELEINRTYIDEAPS